jgi:hypothetical protein
MTNPDINWHISTIVDGWNRPQSISPASGTVAGAGQYGVAIGETLAFRRSHQRAFKQKSCSQWYSRSVILFAHERLWASPCVESCSPTVFVSPIPRTTWNSIQPVGPYLVVHHDSTCLRPGVGLATSMVRRPSSRQ